MSFKSKITTLVLALAILTTLAVSVEEMGKYSINLATNDTLGTYLVNQSGFTLYYFTNDAPGNGSSSCSGKCAALWPAFYAENLTVPMGLNAADFTSQLRGDGKKQIAYKGWPLYLFSKDTEAKDAYGQGYNKVWFVVNPTSSPFKKPATQQTSCPQSGYSSGGSQSVGY